MALTPRSGSPITLSGLNDVPGEVPNTQSDLVTNMPYVTDSNLNKYAINPTQAPNATNMLAGFARGHRVSVTYYRLLKTGGSNIRTNIADYPTTRNVLDTEYQKIVNLEITLPRGFTFETNPNAASISITGQALMYPNMNPNVGDIFLTGTGDGRIGIARISSVAPLSWRTSTFFAVEFVIQSFADSTDIEALDGATSITSIFSKENYLGGTAALLSEDSYTYLKKIAAARGNLARYYHQTFFDSELCSYIRPDGIYDPSCVQFMSSKITIDEVLIKPKNLIGKRPDTYSRTLWGRLEDRYNGSLKGVYPRITLSAYHQSRMGVFVTELSGRTVIFPSDVDTDELYIFTLNFYNGVTASMTAFELLIHTAIHERTMGSLSTLVNTYIDNVYSLTLDEQYYRIPFYMHLIDMALQSQYRDIDAVSMDYAFNGS